MKHFGKKGERLWKSIRLKIITPQSDTPLIRVLNAKPGQGFSKAFIADILAAASLEIKEAFPTHQYRLVELSPSEFNFVPTGVRIPADSEPTIAQPA